MFGSCEITIYVLYIVVVGVDVFRMCVLYLGPVELGQRWTSVPFSKI